ncbi:MAG: dihydroxy-acid dehydratase, partial [Angelakisella sp.]
GPIAVVRDGDIIDIDIDARTIAVRLTPEEIAQRMSELPAFVPPVTEGYLARYARDVSSANEGAVLK